MSLDVYLYSSKPVGKPASSGIFVRENGSTVEISREEWERRNPGRAPVVFKPATEVSMTKEVFSLNITHNLADMAAHAGLYAALWQPEASGYKHAEDLIEPLMGGYRKLCRQPERFKRLNPENGWGNYEQLVEFTGNYLLACIRYPKAKVEVSV